MTLLDSTWHGRLNPKAYYTKHIKEQNDAHLAKQKLNQTRALSVIHRLGGDP